MFVGILKFVRRKIEKLVSISLFLYIYIMISEPEMRVNVSDAFCFQWLFVQCKVIRLICCILGINNECHK